VEELRNIPMVTNLLAKRIVKKRNITAFISVNELLNIDGITSEMLSFIRKYIKIGTKQEGLDSRGYFTSRVSSEIEKRRGFTNNEYLGSSIKALNKFYLLVGNIDAPLSSIINNIELGILSEKDAGELNLMSYLTGFASVSIVPISMRILIGDYRIETAEGLVFGRSYAFSKGSEIIGSAHKNGSGILANRSSNENTFMRGFAADIKTDKIQFQFIYSNKFINATIDSLGQISSFDRSGLFRTKNELKKNNSSREILLGYRANAYLIDGLKIGGTGYFVSFGDPLIIEGVGSSISKCLHIQGMDLSYTCNRIDLFSEFAQDQSNKVAVICGITYEPISTLAMTVMARKYPASFQSIYGNAFSESNGQIQNEEGLYAGIRFRPSDWLWISSYYDQFKYPQFTQSVSVPSNGNYFFMLAESKIAKKFEFAMRYKRKRKQLGFKGNDIFGRTIRENLYRMQDDYRFIGEYDSSPSLKLVSRLEWTNINYDRMQKAEHGLLLSQSIKLIISGSLTLQGRIAIYGTDSYDSRIYEYENDFPRYSSNVVLFGRGIYWCLICKYQLYLHATFAIKYSQMIKEGVSSLGSGLDEIEGDTQSIISMQIDVQF
jgi:hypothetical protein